MPSKKPQIKFHCSETERSLIREKSTRAGLSVSSFIRSVCLGFHVPSREDQQARRELLKVNADLARLGGLLKMAISTGANSEKIDSLIDLLLEQQELLKQGVWACTNQSQGGRTNPTGSITHDQ